MGSFYLEIKLDKIKNYFDRKNYLNTCLEFEVDRVNNNWPSIDLMQVK